jgi:hypothetical protein
LRSTENIPIIKKKIKKYKMKSKIINNKTDVKAQTNVNVKLSINLSKKFKCRIMECYLNSASNLVFILKDIDKNAVYVEGLYCQETKDGFNSLVEHAWITLSDTSILDLTRPAQYGDLLNINGEKFKGHSEANQRMNVPHSYYAIYEFTIQQIISEIKMVKGRVIGSPPFWQKPKYIKDWINKQGMINRIVNDKDYALIDEYLKKPRTQTDFQAM